MGRHKTITDAEVLAIARRVFLARSHSVSTREIAREAGISEAVLYQRFGTKDDLFFAAMAPSEPDLDRILGPEVVEGEVRAFLVDVAGRMREYFAALLPVAIQMMTHPSFDPAAFARSGGRLARVSLVRGLATRVEGFVARGEMRAGSAERVARLLVALAHDSALMSVHSPERRHSQEAARELAELVRALWDGFAPA